MTRDEQLAEELFQEFALRMLRGDFRRAEPLRGRFRDYLKTVIPAVKQQISAEQEAEYQRFGQDLAQAALEGTPVTEVVPARVVSDLPKTQEGVTTAMKWTWRIPGVVEDGKAIEGSDLSLEQSLHFDKIPATYFTLDLVKIGKAVRAGVKIPGIEIYQVPDFRRSPKR